jgi:hypothetical protein
MKITAEDREYWLARQEHAWLLRAEGMSYAEIGRRLGVCRARPRGMIRHFGRVVMRAIRRPRRYTFMRVR